MTRLSHIAALAAPHRLAVFGTMALAPEDGFTADFKCLVLFGPDEPGFWAHLQAQPEWRDGRPDPIDRWSRRVIEALARDLGAAAVFP
ncbi:MAG: ferredoxin, partial [Proteobacteria bacterium]|nr:ferredoxin [Pseudomonadota bacterium]